MIDFAMSRINITLSESRGLKGFSMLLVIFHHFVQHYADYLPSFLLVFRGSGAIACALFFFLSGYGLSISKHEKNGHYWIRRFILIYGSFVLANAIFIAYKLIMDDYEFNGIGEFFANLLGIELVTSAYWFIPCILFMYLAFSLSNRVRIQIFLCLLFGGAYTITQYAPGCMSWLAFLLGIIVARQDNKYDIIHILYILSSLLFVVSFIFYYRHNMLLNEWVNIVFFVCMILTFPISLIMLKSVFQKDILQYIGKNSLDYYLMHFIALSLVEYMFPSSPLMAILLLALLCLLFVFLFKLLRKVSIDKLFSIL